MREHRGMRILGIDFGDVRIGLALGDSEARIASPLDVLVVKNEEQVIHDLLDLLQQERIEKVVIGIPHSLRDRGRSEQARRIMNFAEKLREAGIDVMEEDETMTSKLAAHQAMEAGLKGKRDDLAAAAILQSYLDKR